MDLLQALLLRVLRAVQNVLKVLVCAELQLTRTHMQRDRVNRDCSSKDKADLKILYNVYFYKLVCGFG